MKQLKFTLIGATLFFLNLLQPVYGQTGVAIAATTSTADPSAMLDIQSTSKGALVPRMTNAQRSSISTPANGLLVFCTDAPSGFYYNSGTSSSPNWVILSAGALTGTGTTNYDAMWTGSGTLGSGNIYNSGTNVGIGTSSAPGATFSVGGTTGNFQVTSAGAITAASTITFSNLGSTAGVVLNSSSGVLSSSAGALSIALGGTAATTAAAALTSLGAAPASGSANYIQNNSTTTAAGAQSASLNINGTATIGGSVYFYNNDGGSTNKLYLSGVGTAGGYDPNHYIYSTGTGGNSMFFGEYGGVYNFYNTATASTQISFNAGSISATSLNTNVSGDGDGPLYSNSSGTIVKQTGCPSGYTWESYGISVICIMAVTSSVNANVAEANCENTYSGGHMCYYHEVEYACNKGFGISSGYWLADRPGDDTYFYTNGSSCSNFDACCDNRTGSSLPYYCCIDFIRF